VVAKATALFEFPAYAKGLTLSGIVDPSIPAQLVGDPHHLQQVLTNLIGNAIKFTEKGTVKVEVSLGELRSDSTCSIDFKVIDTGIGIPSDKIAVIFDDFTQSDSSITREYGGTGLGLAISRALVEKMNGSITVESTLGVGSIFQFSVNFAVRADSPNGKSKSNPPRILLCEDSKDNAFVVGAYLSGTDYVVEHVPDGKAGVERFKKGTFDVVLMDMQMPILDGHSATRLIRQWEVDQNLKPTPILALTAHAQIEQMKRCESCGCTGFLSKPIRKATLLAALEQYVRRDAAENQSDVPPEILELVPGYLKQKRADLEKLLLAIEESDYRSISRFGHQLKASGTSYGFEDLSEIGTALERAAQSQDLEETLRQIGLLSDALSNSLSFVSNT